MAKIRQPLLSDILQNKKSAEIEFNHMYKELYPDLLSYCMSYVRSDLMAKDIVQESFISLWESRNTLPQETHLKKYLFVLVRNRSINYLKHKSVELKFKEGKKKEYLSSELSLIAMEYDGSDLMIAAELEDLVNDSINDLPDKCRTVFELSRKDRKKNREIANELSISVKTVEAQISKGLKHLRDKLKEYID